MSISKFENVVEYIISAYRLGKDAEGNENVVNLTRMFRRCIRRKGDQLQLGDAEFLDKFKHSQENQDYIFTADLLLYEFPKTMLYKLLLDENNYV